ncbi:MAG: hypothetical protein ACTSR8_15910 [Promethearchaeota archaeon]
MGGEKKKGCLIFIFNADSGAINSIKDFFHKMIKPSTYQCNLCAVTFGNFGMKKDWAKYIEKIEVEKEVDVEFLHRDEFVKYYPEVEDPKYPSAYFHVPTKTVVLISQEEMNSVQSIDDLKTMINERLDKYI